MTQDAHDSHADGRGQMDIREQLKTWNMFSELVKWGIIGNVALLVFLAIFRTH